MIGYIKGTIEEVRGDSVVIENHGIGYVVKVPLTVLDNVKVGTQETKLYTYTYVREDQLALFGFDSISQLHMFEMLITVNGIGPKAALGILSAMSVSALMMAIVSQDDKLISKAPGIGPKSAKKLILELKDKVSAEDILYQETTDQTGMATTPENSARHDAYLALMALGYDSDSASKAVSSVEGADEMDSDMLLKQALKFMLK